jgi:hypothetical protein
MITMDSSFLLRLSTFLFCLIMAISSVLILNYFWFVLLIYIFIFLIEYKLQGDQENIKQN